MNISLLKCGCMALVWLVLPGCIVPNFDHAAYDRYYAVPLQTDKPWLSLSNGVDLYAYHKCGDVDDVQRCASRSVWVLERPKKPDWRDIGQFDVSVWDTTRLRFQSLLSAHANTTYRAVGLTEGESSTIYLMRPGYDRGQRFPLEGNKAGILELGLRGNTSCHSYVPIPRLVVFDTDNMWIFAEIESKCQKDIVSDFVPIDILRFEGGHQFDTILRTPMKLFYMSSTFMPKSDYQQPRRVLHDADLPMGSTPRTMRLSEVARPQNTVFQLELTPVPPTLPVPDRPNFYCHYSDTVIGIKLAWTDKNANPGFKYCRPYRGK